MKSVLGKGGIPKAEKRMGWRSRLGWGDGNEENIGEKIPFCFAQGEEERNHFKIHWNILCLTRFVPRRN